MVDGVFIFVTGYVIRRGYLFIKIFCFPCAWFTLWWSSTPLFSQTGNRRQWVSLLSFFINCAHLPGRGGRGGETLMIVVLSLRGLNHKFWSHWGCSEREVTDLKVNSNFARKSPTFSRGSLLGVHLWKKVCSLGTLRQKHHRKNFSSLLITDSVCAHFTGLITKVLNIFNVLQLSCVF